MCLLILNTFPTTIFFLKSELWAESYGPEKFRLFYSIYSCMLQVSYFSSCTFTGAHNQNLTPLLASMGHNLSIDYSHDPNRLLSIELCPLEVILVPKLYPHFFGCNFLIRALFREPFSSLDNSLIFLLFDL